MTVAQFESQQHDVMEVQDWFVQEDAQADWDAEDKQDWHNATH